MVIKEKKGVILMGTFITKKGEIGSMKREGNDDDGYYEYML